MSDKTIDGRGFDIHVAGGAGFMFQFVHNIIIHGLHMYDIVEGSGGMIRSKDNHVGIRGRSDGDAVSIFKSSQVWIDHCSFASSYDGLIDIVAASTNITISNCHFVKHDKVHCNWSNRFPSENNNLYLRNWFGLKHFCLVTINILARGIEICKLSSLLAHLTLLCSG